jgi:hypothetical protein
MSSTVADDREGIKSGIEPEQSGKGTILIANRPTFTIVDAMLIAYWPA